RTPNNPFAGAGPKCYRSVTFSFLGGREASGISTCRLCLASAPTHRACAQCHTTAAIRNSRAAHPVHHNRRLSPGALLPCRDRRVQHGDKGELPPLRSRSFPWREPVRTAF